MQCKICKQDFPTKFYFFNQNPEFPCIYCAKKFATFNCSLEESLNKLSCVLNLDKWFDQLEHQGIRLLPSVKQFVRKNHALLLNESHVTVSLQPQKIIFKTQKIGYKHALFLMALLYSLWVFAVVKLPDYFYYMVALFLFMLVVVFFRLREIRYSEKIVEVNFERNELFFMVLKDPEHARVIEFKEIKEFEKQYIADKFRPHITGEIIAYLKNDIRIKLLEFENKALFKNVYKFLQENIIQ